MASAENIQIDMDAARKRIGAGALTLAILAAFIVFQFVMTWLQNSDDYGLADEAKSLLTYLGVYSVLAFALAGFAFFMKSRIALSLGLICFVVNWIDFVMLIVQGEFSSPGILNIIGPFFVGRALWEAIRYHRLKKQVPDVIDVETFA